MACDTFPPFSEHHRFFVTQTRHFCFIFASGEEILDGSYLAIVLAHAELSRNHGRTSDSLCFPPTPEDAIETGAGRLASVDGNATLFLC